MAASNFNSYEVVDPNDQLPPDAGSLRADLNSSNLGHQFLDTPNPELNPNLMSIDESTTPAAPTEGQKLSSLFARTPFAEKASKSKDNSAEKWSSFTNKWESKKSGLMQQALPALRELNNKAQNFKMTGLEKYNETKHQLVNQVVSDLNLSGAESVASASATAATESVEAKRWWAEACKALHATHNVDFEDPPAPPQRALSDAAGVESGTGSRGVLEVELLSFSESAVISRRDGTPAVRPICQAAFGNRYTGALRPRFDRARKERPTVHCESEQQGADVGFTTVASTTSVAAGEENSTPSSGSRAEATCVDCSIARFPVDEISGCDLRLHVFDSKSMSFEMGNEVQAFCGGALVPLNVLLRHQASRNFYLEGFWHREIEKQIQVRLLPLEAVRMVRKLKPAAEFGNHELERPSTSLGQIELRLRLTVYDMVPARLYTTIPFHGDTVDTNGTSFVGQIDDPMSVLKAVAAAVQRVTRVIDTEFWESVADELRETPHTAAMLHVFWASGMLIVPVWKLPAIFLMAFIMIAAQIAISGRRVRLENPLIFYKDELTQDGSSLTLKERAKKNASSAIKVQLGLMRFAQTLNVAATKLEKIRFLVMLRDPYLSILCFGFLVVAMFCITTILGIFLAIFGRFGPPLLIWAYGSLALLPRVARARVFDFLELLQEMKIRYIGPGKLTQILESFWARIPDDLETQHCELFDRYCLLP